MQKTASQATPTKGNDTANLVKFTTGTWEVIGDTDSIRVVNRNSLLEATQLTPKEETFLTVMRKACEPKPEDRDRYEIIVNRERDDDYRRGNL